MTWPNATDYNAAVQNPHLCFDDDELRRGQVVGDLFGLPRPHSGNFADVYQIQGGGAQSWAVKCFTRPVAGLRPRYQAISEHLRQTQRAFMVEFGFLDEGIRVAGQWHPLVKMRWVEGFRLNEFVREQLDKPVVLDRLAQMWLRLARELREARMAHGDLQHGNVLLVPGTKSSSLSLKLIDYDGMYVPSLADRPSGEVGHPNYQHPQRLRGGGGYGLEMDRFAHLLVYTALRCLHSGGAELWPCYDNGENLLFREDDFRRPNKSRLLRQLWNFQDRNCRNLAGHLVLASQGPLLVVPAVDELLDGNSVRPLNDSEETQINVLLGVSAARAPRTRIMKMAAETVEMPASALVLLAEPNAESAADTAIHSTSRDATTPDLPLIRGSAKGEERGARKSDPSPLLVDSLVSILSRPAWLAVLGVIAVLCFLVVNVLIWTAFKKPVEVEPTAPSLPTQAGTDALDKDKPEGEAVAPPPSPQADKTPPTQNKQTRTPPRLQIKKMPDTLSLRAGGKEELEVSLARGECLGEVEVRLENLPDGVTAPPVRVPPGHWTALLTIEAEKEAKIGSAAVKIFAVPNGQQIAERTLTLTIEQAEPPKQTATDNRGKRVTFSTADHARLAGTLYPGKHGKKGACVLMLHDLGRDRKAEGWVRLAEALQEQGHTVLTFDFRGHGDSKRALRDFWELQVNRNLPVYKNGKTTEAAPKTIDADDFSSEYMPWLIHDIAAARMFLDRQHEDRQSSVNSSNLLVFGAGRGAALGSLWLASEAIRYDAKDTDKKSKPIALKNCDIVAAVWLNMEVEWKDHKFPVGQWVHWVLHTPPDSKLPMEFLFGGEDAAAALVVGEVSRGNNGKLVKIPDAKLAGMTLLDKDAKAEKFVRDRLVKILKEHKQRKWKPRKLSTFHSYWGFPAPWGTDFYLARRPGERLQHLVPLLGFGIRLKDMPKPPIVVPGMEE